MESRDSAAVRATRLRDNKRNYRSRQKEYVADLERTVREYRERGVQATKEVQLSALKVVRENTRLRQLLQKSGVDDGTIEAWLCDDPAHGEMTDLVHGQEFLGSRGPPARLTFVRRSLPGSGEILLMIISGRLSGKWCNRDRRRTSHQYCIGDVLS